MQPSNYDKAYLWDILTACSDILGFVENIGFRDFENDKMRRFAVERQLMVIGEAANHLSKELQDENPQVPWKLIIGLRNVVAHEYGEILVERIFKNAVENVPMLKNQISRIIGSSET